MQRPVLLLVIAACLYLTGCHAAVGPQIGYTFDRGTSYGWEGGGGVAYIRGNVGQVVRPGAANAESDTSEEWVSYIAAEPWFFVGGTLGAAYSDQSGFGLSAGAWEGLAAPLAGDGGDFDCGSTNRCRPVVSIAGGLRYLNGEFELYLTPKVGIVQTISFF